MAANYLHLPGVTGNFAWVPNVANLNGTGTLEFIAKVNLDVWPPDANQILISKWTGSAGYLFFLESTSNDLKLMWRDSGPARIAQATVTPTVTAGDWLWFRAVATEDGVDRDVLFYTSMDTTNDPDEVTWTQLGAEVVVPFGAADLTTNTAVVFVGAQSATVATMAGSIAAARVNFAGVTELDIDFTDLTAAEVDAGSFTEDSSNAATVTIAGAAWAYVRGGAPRRFFLDTFIGDGTDENPFRAEHANGDFSIIDLRADPTQVAGFCLVGAEGMVGTPDWDFGDTLDQQLSSNRKQTLGNRLGLTLEQTDFRAVITELLLLHGREDGTRWRPLKQNQAGNHKIVLGGQVVYDAPVIQGTTLQDTFVEGSDTNIESHTATGPNSGFSWTLVDGIAGDLVVEATPDDVHAGAAVANPRARAESDLASDDHYSEMVVGTWPTTDNTNIAPIVRYNTSADSCYLMLLRDRVDDEYRLFKLTDGSFSLLASVNGTLPSPPATARLEVNGSNLEGFMDTVSKITNTDTSFTGQVRTGFLCSWGSDFDDFEAADLAAAPAAPVVRRRQLTTVRM